MKNIILIVLIFIFLPSCNNKVQEEKHLTFLEIPIAGNISYFKNKLQEKGFKDNSSEDFYYFNGKIDNSDVDVALSTTPISKSVYMVSVLFTERPDTSSLKSEYNNLVKTLTIKYGKPTSIRTKIGVYNSDKFTTEWITKEGTIGCSIASKLNRCSVVYFDSKSSDLDYQEKYQNKL